MAEDKDTTRQLGRLLEIMARLRSRDGGCPWDLEQDFASIAPYTVEEAYEVAAAIAEGDMAGLKGELGDLLFQVVFHARMAEEAGHFDFAAVAQGIADKMEARHPHVFGRTEIADASAQTLAWEAHKAAERARQATDAGRSASSLDGLPLALPALMRALKLQSRAARVGFDWPAPAPVLDKLAEELAEMRQAMAASDAVAISEELGDLLFTVVNLARHLSVDAEDALRRANAKFERRFRRVEGLAAAGGETLADCSAEALDRLWQAAKAEER
jgi:MazG family protein